MKIEIPTGWEQVTLLQYLDIKGITESSLLNDFEKELQILSILTGKETEAFNELPISKIKELFKLIDWVYVEPKGDIKDHYQIGSRKYKLIKDVRQLTAGQFIDLCHYTKDKETVLDNIANILSILLIPVKPLKTNEKILNGIHKVATKVNKIKQQAEKTGWKIQEGEVEKYMETPLEETVENILHNMKVTEAFGISLFFYLFFTSSLKVTQDFLEQKLKSQLQSTLTTLPEMKEKQKIQKLIKQLDFMRDGDGSQLSTI